MPRPQYPSDELRRRVRPHVKVHLTVRTHRRTAEVWMSPELRGMAVGLWQLAAEAFAGKTGNRVHLDRTAVMWISGRAQYAHAERALRALCARLEYPVSTLGALVVVEVRNFEQKQGFHSATGGARLRAPFPSDSDSDSDSDSSSLRSEEKEPEPAAPPLGTDLLGEPVKPKHRDFRAEARAAWPAAVEAAARHGRRWETLSESRLAAAAARMREHPEVPDVLVRLVEGAMAYWRVAKPKDANLTANLDPDTVFRASHAEKYLEAGALNGHGGKLAPSSVEDAKRIVAEKRRAHDELWNEAPS